MASKNANKDCAVCLGAHDEPIHLATVRLHLWWRESLLGRINVTDSGEVQAPGRTAE